MRIKMLPSVEQGSKEVSGIGTVIKKYGKHLPAHGIEFTNGDDYDLLIGHAGMSDGRLVDVAALHGLYFTGDYPAPDWEYESNKRTIQAIRGALAVTVPSEWVAEILRREFRIKPYVVPHGVDWDEWQHSKPVENFVLAYAKNRAGQDVCDPSFLKVFAPMFPNINFVSTFLDEHIDNVVVTGVLPHGKMKKTIQAAQVYINTTKETFGITMLEALASGTPVLAYNHGGATDIVEHGVNGYLAHPGDLDDLADGLEFCIENREVLSVNARELAKKFTWERVAEILKDVLDETHQLKLQPQTVGVVIPVYNKPIGEVTRAIESVLAQTRMVDQVVVINDASNNGIDYESLVKKYKGVAYLENAENSGVAVTRNNGVNYLQTKYVCCLDSDDWLGEEFIEICLDALVNDGTLGVAYTGLQWHKSDGTTGLSQWPGEYDYDRFLMKQNQIPTCCVYRKDLWTRLGGYKKRYSPQGAGAEDAEFFLRMGSIGYGGKKASSKGLFHYSWLSGIVSGNPNYQEPDWLAWHPWTRDDTHPIGSLATPHNRSHKVYQRDEPYISVVIPVGGDHHKYLENALDSLESQTFRKWEVIVVWDTVPPREWREWYENAYPYVTNIIGFNLGNFIVSQGAGHARNEGAAIAEAPFLLFLDADDWLYPQALMRMVQVWNEEESAVYSDYTGIAYVDDPGQLAADLHPHIKSYDPDTKKAIIEYRALDYDCERAQHQPEDSPYLWCNITTLFPRQWHIDIGGFDESMESWEDVDYWYRMAQQGRCFVRVAEPLLVYRFYSGGRRDVGLHRHAELIEYLRTKYNNSRDNFMGCGCGKKNKSIATQPSNMSRSAAVLLTRASSNTGNTNMIEDKNMILVKYMHPNRGQHAVIGAATRIKYGYRAGGSTFLVHKDDIAAAANMFHPVNIPAPPAPAPRVTPRPRPITIPKRAEIATPSPVLVDARLSESLQVPVSQPVATEADIEWAEKAIEEIEEEREFYLGGLPGITPRLEEAMRKAGLVSPEQILGVGVKGLTAVKGLGNAKASLVYEYVKENYA